MFSVLLDREQILEIIKPVRLSGRAFACPFANLIKNIRENSNNLRQVPQDTNYAMLKRRKLKYRVI